MEYDIQPLEGHAIITMKPAYGDFEGDFFIPKGAKSRTTCGRMGLVVSLTLYPENELSPVFVGGKLKLRPAYIFNDRYAEMFEKYVLCRNATLIFGSMYDVRLEHIQAIVPEEAQSSEDELGRCRQCKSKGEANILLGPDGFCPVCGFNKYGIHETADELDVTEDDIDFLVRKPAEVNHFMRTGGKALKGNIISYPGQQNRARLEVARLNELNKFMKGKVEMNLDLSDGLTEPVDNEVKEAVFEGTLQDTVPDSYSSEYDNIVGENWISNSALSLAMSCGYAFYYKYVLRLPEARGIRSTAGSGSHKGREVNLKQKIVSGVDLSVSECADAARDYVHKVFDENPIQDDGEFEGKPLNQLRDITTDFAVEIAITDYNEFQPVIKPKLVEYRMAIKVPGMSRSIVGMCDNIEINDDIRDLKSSKRSWGQAKADDAAGMTTYGLMRYAETGKLPENYYIDNVVCSGKTPAKANSLVTTRTKAKLEQHLARFIQVNKVIDAGLFMPCDPEHWKCSKAYCGFYLTCPFGQERKG